MSVSYKKYILGKAFVDIPKYRLYFGSLSKPVNIKIKDLQWI